MAKPITKIPELILENSTDMFMHNYCEAFGEMCGNSDRKRPIKILDIATNIWDVTIPITEYPEINHKNYPVTNYQYSNPLIEMVDKGQFIEEWDYWCTRHKVTIKDCTLYLLTHRWYDDSQGLWLQGEGFQYNF